ncbi:MAG: hypothetical protein WAW07_10950 [Bacteroidales bacterium]
MLKNLLKKILNDIYNLKGWKTDRKLIVIESDDWGSIRMPDLNTYNILFSKGVRVDKCPFTKYDSLESSEDLEKLIEVLLSFKDYKGHNPSLTANCVLANPDFEKISDSGFLNYHYESITDTFEKYSFSKNPIILWKEGIRQGVFTPQFHGREHLNVKRWMKALHDNMPETRLAFDLKMYGISSTITSENRRSYLEAFSMDEESDIELLAKIIEDGLRLFKLVFDATPLSFIAPNYIWPPDIESVLYRNGIKYIQGQRIQLSPQVKSPRSKRIAHYTGETNLIGQIYSVRNCLFEPTLFPGTDNLGNCMRQIEYAFKRRKPSIIASHRLNFVGSLDEGNRDRNLLLLRKLLEGITRKWPEVEFVSSDTLGDLMYQDLYSNR